MSRNQDIAKKSPVQAMQKYLLTLGLVASLVCLLGLAACNSKPEPNSIITKTMEKRSLARSNELVQGCQVCHGIKEAQRGPILDGMEYWYLYDQLQKFRSGIRGQNPENRSEHLMGIGVKKINNDLESAYLADWFARQTPKPAVRTVQGDLERGKLFYEARCASCHGDKAEGNRLLAGPALNRLEGWYFLEQMRKFRTGERGYHLLDETGRVMAAASKGISNDSLKDVVAYVVDAFGPEDEPSLRDRMVPAKSEKPF
ncbi:MAG: c-type cytochrome [Opitutales bacterium]